MNKIYALPLIIVCLAGCQKTQHAVDQSPVSVDNAAANGKVVFTAPTFESTDADMSDTQRSTKAAKILAQFAKANGSLRISSATYLEIQTVGSNLWEVDAILASDFVDGFRVGMRTAVPSAADALALKTMMMDPSFQFTCNKASFSSEDYGLDFKCMNYDIGQVKNQP